MELSRLRSSWLLLLCDRLASVALCKASGVLSGQPCVTRSVLTPMVEFSAVSTNDEEKPEHLNTDKLIRA